MILGAANKFNFCASLALKLKVSWATSSQWAFKIIRIRSDNRAW
jgi:hypothetical protein